jgi:hypothetical protein
MELNRLESKKEQTYYRWREQYGGMKVEVIQTVSAALQLSV